MASKYDPRRVACTITCKSAGVVIGDACGNERRKVVTRVTRVLEGSASVECLQHRVPAPDGAPLPHRVIIIAPSCVTG